MFLGTYYSLRDFFWSGVCHTSAASALRELGPPRMKLPARRAELKKSVYTRVHSIHGCMILPRIQRYTNVQILGYVYYDLLLEINMTCMTL